MAKVLVIYDTMWQSTALMAEAIAEGASQPGIEVRLRRLRRENLAEIAAEVFEAAAVALGSPTQVRGMTPTAAAAMERLSELRPPGKLALAFGSYGWGAGGPEAIHAALKAMDWRLLREPIKSHRRPSAAVLEECRQAGRLLAEEAKRQGELKSGEA